MTAKSSQKLADALRAAGFDELADRAALDEFHDFLSPHESPAIRLAFELASTARQAASVQQRNAAHFIRGRVVDGEFDATNEEADEWAQSREGRATTRSLRGRGR
jgi:hypothetical protein